MSYLITLRGTAHPEDVRAVFEDTVRALRAIATEVGDEPPGGALQIDQGMSSGSFDAREVVALAAADTTDDEPEDGEGDNNGDPGATPAT